jgi:hypothetical protein
LGHYLLVIADFYWKTTKQNLPAECLYVFLDPIDTHLPLPLFEHVLALQSKLTAAVAQNSTIKKA